eukprot:s1807_g4.t1
MQHWWTGGFCPELTALSLVDNWNQVQTYPEQQLRNGDRIIAVTSGGKTCRDGRLMAARLKENGDVTLTVAVSRTLEEVERCWQRMTGMVTLQDLVLEEVAELGPPEMSSAGPALDKVALEVLKVGPRLAEWNQNCLSKGLCCTQRLEVGDRVISIGGSTNVRKGLRLPSPTVTLVRWQPIGTSCCKNFEAVARWNASSNTPILPGDCIVSVNGMTAYSKLQKDGFTVSMIFLVASSSWDAGPTLGIGGLCAHSPFPRPNHSYSGPTTHAAVKRHAAIAQSGSCPCASAKATLSSTTSLLASIGCLVALAFCALIGLDTFRVVEGNSAEGPKRQKLCEILLCLHKTML